MTCKTGSLRDERGMTLMEMMAVVVIISILTGIAVVSYSFSTDVAKETACKANIRTLQSAIETYNGQYQGYPPDLAALVPEFIKDAKSLICPSSGQPYTYNNANGAVSCSTCEP